MGSGGSAKTPAPTAQERELAGVGAEQWNDYARRYAGPGGVNEKFIETTRTTEGDIQRVKGTVSADVAQQKRTEKEQTSQAGLARGISSSSGAAISDQAKLANETASTKGRAMGVAEEAAKETELAADFKLASFGRGLGDTAQVGLQGATSRATELLTSSAISRAKERQSLMEAAGTGIGMYAQTKGLFKKKKNPKEDYDMDGG